MMRCKQLYGLLVGVLLVWSTSASAIGENVLPNSSFETYDCSTFGCQFLDWSMPLGTGSANATDKIDGEVSLELKASFESVLDNFVYLPDNIYAEGTLFQITIQYKVLSLPANQSLKLDCFWEAAASGDSEAAQQHDADKLRVLLTDSMSSAWEKMEVVTSKPTLSSNLRVRVVIPKNAKVLFDAFAVNELVEDPNAPYIRVTPLQVPAVSTTIGHTVDFETIHVEQGNITGMTEFYLSGYDPEMFILSANYVSDDQSEVDLVVTYAPTQAGTHTAILNIDNINHTTLFQSVILRGSCTDPSKQASISVTPSVLPHFEVVAGQEQTATFTVTAENCSDFVYLQVTHVQGAAFTINSSMAVRNGSTDVEARFLPLDSGEYKSFVTVYSEGVEPVVLFLNGTGLKRDESTIDWMTMFKWDESNPLKLMNETFDSVGHNKTLKLKGWQNVAPVDERPWWGFDEDKTSPKRGTGRYAKATAYQYGKGKTDTWEMYLVTPPLDYKNAEGKIFVFSIMGEYMPDEPTSETMLEIYYVDATGDKVYFQDLTESFVIPSLGEDNNIWRTFFLDLAPYAETMADVFHMAFRYVGPNGGEGAVTYYIDNVSWGRTDLPQIIANPTYVIDSTAVVGERKVLAEIEVTSKNLTGEIYISMAGPNYNRFSVSPTSLPITGGTFTLSFEGQEAGVHEAYVVLSSKDAPDTFIPVAVRCNETTEMDETISLTTNSRKVLRDGQLFIERSGKTFNVLGTQVR